MGVTVAANLLVGVRLEKRKTTVALTKYNETTGEPYQQEISVFNWNIADTEIGLIFDEWNSDRIFDVEDLHAIGVGEGVYGPSMLGFIIGSVYDDDRHPSVILESKIAEAKTKLAKILKDAIGYEGEISLLLYVSAF